MDHQFECAKSCKESQSMITKTHDSGFAINIPRFFQDAVSELLLANATAAHVSCLLIAVLIDSVAVWKVHAQKRITATVPEVRSLITEKRSGFLFGIKLCA